MRKSRLFGKKLCLNLVIREVNLALLRRRVTKHFNIHLLKCKRLKALLIISFHKTYPARLQIDLPTSQGKSTDHGFSA